MDYRIHWATTPAYNSMQVRVPIDKAWFKSYVADELINGEMYC